MEAYIIEDLEARIDAVLARQEFLDSFVHDMQRNTEHLSGYVSTKADAHYVVDISSEIEFLRHDVSEIKTAILEIHDTLRAMGMDDMSRRLGDLNLLLT